MAARKKTTRKSNTQKKSQGVVAVFDFFKTTKNTHRMQEINANGEPIGSDEGAAVGSLYLQKSKFGATAPKQVRVEIIVIE